MKYLITLIIITLFSCDIKHTNIVCPCIVSQIKFNANSKMYIITVTGENLGNYGDVNSNPQFSFFSKNLYNIGDTIK